LQGRWATPVTTPAASFGLIVLPAAGGGTQAWVLAQDASVLAKLTGTDGVTVGAVGKSYTFNAAGNQVITAINGSVTPLLNATPKTLTVNGLLPAPVAFSQTGPLTAPAVQTDLSGNWRASVAQGAQVVNWTVNAAGAVTGTSSTGCTWSGNLLALTTATAYTADVTETCPGSPALRFIGVTTISDAKTQFTTIGTTADESKAIVLFMAKQP
jgi:hypothetical protein